MRERLIRLLAARRARVAAIFAGLLLLAPSIPSGLAADDWFHRLVLTGSRALGGVHHDALRLFVFSDGDPAVGRAQQDSGMIGWWADPETAIAYFRPLSSFTHWLDYRLWPDLPWVMHLQSGLWFAAALVALAAVYRRFSPGPGPATLALLLYAVDDAHGFVVSWIANRNALVALALGLPVLVLHDRARRGGEVGAGRLAALLFAVALLAGESAVAVAGYLLAYALTLDPGRSAERLRAFLPYAMVFLVWRAVYALLGFGTRGSGLSVDPVADPIGFLAAAAGRAPVLLAAQLAAPPSDLWEIFPVVAPLAQPVVLAVAAVLLVGLPLLLRGPLREEPALRFFALGALFSVLPATAQVPHDRLLLYAGVGAQALVARLLHALLAREAWTRRPGGGGASVSLRAAGYGLALFHLGIAPLWLPLRARGPSDVRTLLARADRSLPSGAEVRGKTVVLVNPPADAFAGYLPMWRAAEGREGPARLRWLATGASRLTIERTSARRLRVESEGGFLRLASERMQRSLARPFQVGERVEIPGLTVEVLSLTADGRPLAVSAELDLRLEDPDLRLYEWSDGGYVPFRIPAV
ncbi:MAG: hypothetical protein FJ104_14465, partial [Deltaproteobacteria bacterium]|nr:hypothetical protein [Deltaproteobacteria bacterium]